MKTAMIARCMFASAAIFAAAGLVGCGAESGAPGEGVGESSQALHGNNPTVAVSGGANMTTGRQEPGSCQIDVNGTLKMLVAGGFDSAGTTALSSIEEYTPGTGAWAVAKDHGGSNVILSQARGLLKGIQLPGDVHSCAFVGGQSTLDSVTGTVTYTTVDIITVNASGEYVRASTGNLAAARAHFELSICNDKLIAFGGSHFNSGLGQEEGLSGIEVSDTAGTTWASKANFVSSTKLKDFGFAKDPEAAAADARFVLAGGVIPGGAESKLLQVVTTATSSGITCNTVTVTRANDTTTHNPVDLAQVIEGTRVFHDGVASSDTFVRAAGSASALTPKLTLGTETIHVTNWGLARVTMGTGISLTVGSHLPALGGLITDGANDKASLLVGGDDKPGYGSESSIAVTDAVQEYQTAQTLMKVNTSAQRARATAQTFGGLVYVAGGGSVATGAMTLNLTTQIVTP